jgi:hypothetical protein
MLIVYPLETLKLLSRSHILAKEPQLSQSQICTYINRLHSVLEATIHHPVNIIRV